MADNLADNFDQAWRLLLLTKITTKNAIMTLSMPKHRAAHTIAGATA